MNIRDIIEDDLARLNNKDYIFEKVNGEYKPIKFNDFVAKSKAFATFLVDSGLKNKTVILIGKNSINLMIADVAVTFYTGICASMAFDVTAEDIKDAVDSLGAEAILFTSDQAEKVSNINTEAKKINLDEVLPTLNEIREDWKEYNIDEPAKIIFTGGSTSKPKGVKLSLRNIFFGWEPLKRRAEFVESDVMYFFLPLSHTYADIYIFYYSFISGLSLYICSDTAKIGEELREVRPTIFCAVPLIYERIAEACNSDVSQAFGDRIRFLFAGGAPIKDELKATYKKAGLEILNAYALTETASSFAIDYPGQTDTDAVGTVFEELDVKTIDTDDNGVGEVCVKGDCVFCGYTTETTNPFTEDGYFKTGDLGYVKDGKLFITGRKKKVLIGSNGENIYVTDIQAKLRKMDSNINFVRLSLKDDKLDALFFLQNPDNTDLDKLVADYNENCDHKDIIHSYSLSEKRNNDKLVD
ncbi:AMP-binding protein [Candidatus Saccharibacteria bacterium]|nr:AMP-binding protein [Candidatus Saccharibacteria bacterium]